MDIGILVSTSTVNSLVGDTSPALFLQATKYRNLPSFSIGTCFFFIVLKSMASTASNLPSIASKSLVVLLYLHNAGSSVSTANVVDEGTSATGFGNADILFMIGGVGSTFMTKDLNVIPFPSLHLTKSLCIDESPLGILLKSGVSCRVPPLITNFSMNSKLKSLSRKCLHSALLSVSMPRSNTDLEAVPNSGLTSLIERGIASTTNSTDFLTLFFAKSLASTSSRLLPSDMFTDAVNNLLFADENLSFISSDPILTELRAASLSNSNFMDINDLFKIAPFSGSMARFGLLLSMIMICDS